MTLSFDLGYQAIDDDHGMIVVGSDLVPATAADAVATLIDLAATAEPADPVSRSPTIECAARGGW